ncbi:ficolin-1-like [Anopheles maculipalpis]|uniref:ficolin-1-like n=1 Tax=Anopheles maculipalpis TaxID=1496333 RepID=UPI0021592A0A|nr:ficolin-1-like [Anopheles maculipalpis]
MKSFFVLLLLFCYKSADGATTDPIVSNQPTSQAGFALEMILAKLNILEHQYIERQLQTDEKITILTARIEQLVKSIENLSWIAQNTEETVHQLGLTGKHMQQNVTFIQRDLTELLAGQKLVVTTHQFGDYVLNKGCNTSTVSWTNDEHYTTYKSCSKIPFKQSGVYRIRPEKPFKQPITVLCDLEFESGGWTVIQHRFDGSVNFYRGWKDYTEGFGNFDGEFWLGLERIHQLTVSEPHELVILLEDFDGNKTIARYDQFQIGTEIQRYQLTTIAGYSGTAGDSLSDLKGNSFTTQDADNDTWDKNCAVSYHGAWWYGACHASNLNGKYLRGETTESAVGMVWKSFRDYDYALKSSKMMIRPKAT